MSILFLNDFLTNGHYIVIVAIIAAIVIIQLCVYGNTKRKINRFKSIFPKTADDYALKRDHLVEYVKKAGIKELKNMLETYKCDLSRYDNVTTGRDGMPIYGFNKQKAVFDLISHINKTVEGIVHSHNNPIFNTIVDSINSYLDKNESVNDFNLMKDIVDRNCDSNEDEISTQIPIPLYLGLVGTMSGILVGVGFLWLTGGLSDLLSTGGNGSGAEGIEALLGGVALAMISSILGILLTTFASNKFKKAKTGFENNKNLFLSWIQATLLPKLSDSTVDALRKMTDNLSSFNERFEKNIAGLDSALSKVGESYNQQTKLMEAVQKLADKDLSMKNLQLFTALTNSTEQIEKLNTYLTYSNEYIANVRALNENLASQEKRTRVMEDVGEFIKTELGQIEKRKEDIGKAVGKVDDYLQQSFDKLKEKADKQLEELKKEVGKQDDVLKRKSEELDKIVSELHQLTDVKQSISDFAKEMKNQNQRLDKLSDSIRALAAAKTGDNTVMSRSFVREPEEEKPLWFRVLIPTALALGGVFVLSLIIANWGTILEFLETVFKF